MKTEKRILLVDDERHMLRLLGFALRDVHAAVESCSSGVEAIAFLEKHSYDLLILDYSMPELNGVETLRRIRQSPGSRDLAVIMLTARDQTLIRREASGLEIAAFMTKPFSPSVLARKAEELLLL